MSLNILKLEKQHPSFSHAQDLEDICKPLRSLNITSFANTRMNNDNSFSVLANNPACFKIWVEKKHYMADISTDPSYCHLLNCIMWDTINAKGETAAYLKDASDHQHAHPFTIIKKHNSHINSYSFGTDIKNDYINQLYINNFDLLESFIDFFNHIVDESPNLKSAYNLQFEHPEGAINYEGSLNLDEVKSDEFYRQLSKKQLSYNFTRREWDCIPMIMSGKTMNEIATALHISPRTVECHIVSLKNKVKARNKEELIIKLLKLKMHKFSI